MSIVDRQRFYLSRADLPVFLRHKGGSIKFRAVTALTAVAGGLSLFQVYSMIFKLNKDPNSPINAA